MKLSEIKGDRVIDVIADIIEPLFNIGTDEVASGILKRSERPEGMDARTYALQRVKTSLPALLKSHKDDLIEIMAIINDVDPQEYRENLNMALFIKDLADVLTDDDLLAFLS